MKIDKQLKLNKTLNSKSPINEIKELKNKEIK